MTDPNGPASDRPDDRRPFDGDRDGDVTDADQRDPSADGSTDDHRPAGAPTDFGAADGPAVDFGGPAASAGASPADGRAPYGSADGGADGSGYGSGYGSADGGQGHDGRGEPSVPARAPGDDADSPIADGSSDRDRDRSFDGDRDRSSDALPEADVDGEVVSTERAEQRDERSGGTLADHSETERLDGHGVGLGAATTGGVGAAVAGGSGDADRRPLHDDDALRAAEAHQATPSDRDEQGGRVPPIAERTGDSDRDRDRDRDRSGDGDRDRDRDADGASERDAPRVPAWSTAGAGAAGAGAAAGASGARPSGNYPLVHEENPDRSTVRRQTLIAQRDEFSGMKFGAGLLGWFAATGFGVVLFAIFAAVVGGIVASQADGSSRQQYLDDNATTGAITVAIAVGVIVFLGYFVGGYTASRMARFSGFKQGLAVFLWGVIISVVLTIVGLVAGAQGAGGPMGGFGGANDVTLLGSPALDAVVAVLVLLVLAFGGAVLGGLAGQRYHRRIDRFEPVEWPEA